MSGQWHEDDGDQYSVGGVIVPRSKPRFSFKEVKLLLEAVKRNRNIVLKKFNYRVPPEAKKRAWAEITEQVNDLGENHREVRQIMKKWADLKCDGQRRIAALHGPNGNNLRKKRLGPVEKMVHKILMMSPDERKADGESDLDDQEEKSIFPKHRSHHAMEDPAPSPFSYLSMTDGSLPLPGGASFECSPLSSPEKELSSETLHSSPDFDLDEGDDGDCAMDFDDDDDSYSCHSSLAPPASAPLDPLPGDSLLRSKPVYTYSRTNHHSQSQAPTKPPPGPACSSSASTSSALQPVPDSNASSSSSVSPPPPSDSPSHANLPAPPSSSSFPPPPASPSSSTSLAANDSSSQPTLTSSSIPPPPAPLPPPPPSVSSSVTTPTTSGLSPSLLPPPQPTASSSSSQQPLPSSSVLPADHPSPHSGSTPSDPLPAGASSRRAQDYVAQLATQSLQQQRASRMLLSSVSHSLETLAQSVQLLVESQQEFVQESLLLQRETVEILRDFSNTTLAMLRDKSNSGHVGVQRPAPHY